jgi:hypothetical protein
LIRDCDIWPCATLVINDYGDKAELEAAAMADDFLAKRNIELFGSGL